MNVLFDAVIHWMQSLHLSTMSDSNVDSGADVAQEKSLFVHNFPATFSETDTRQLLQLFDPISIEILMPHRAVYATFSTREHAKDVLIALHQQKFDGKRLYVEYAEGNIGKITSIMKRSVGPGDKRDEVNFTSPSNEATFTNVLSILYATADNLNFNQPPPPHLCYNYPSANRDIIDSISIALETSRNFYVQVLHLMNRMNLEPPFVPDDKKLKYDQRFESNTNQSSTNKNVSTQTEEIVWQNFIRNKRKRMASDESELETASSDEDRQVTQQLTQPQQKLSNDRVSIKDKQKTRQMLKMQRIQMVANEEKRQTIDKKSSISSAFESPCPVAKAIKIIAPKRLKPMSPPSFTSVTPVDIDLDDPSETSSTATDCATNALLTDAQIQENRMPDEQLKMYSLFQNYEPGEITNRLYIKNIAKEVTENDLKAIYERYLEENCNGLGNVRSIDVRLMQSGRMKGQAFVTFNGPYLHSDGDEIADAQKYQMIAKALRETNGLIVKSKVLVVTYGKTK